MNRREIVDYYKQEIINMEEWYHPNNSFGSPWSETDIIKINRYRAIVDFLSGPTPDPDTGLVPCGCGGKAVFDSAYRDDEVESSYTAEVYCELCEIRTPIFRENADVKAAWNRAMGWKGGAEE